MLNKIRYPSAPVFYKQIVSTCRHKRFDDSLSIYSNSVSVLSLSSLMILRKTIIIINFGRPALRRQFDDKENIHHETQNEYQSRKMSTNNESFY